MKYTPRILSLNEFVLKLARELNTVGICFDDQPNRSYRLRTCSLETCSRQFWTTSESSKRFPVCSDEHRDELERVLNSARQRRYKAKQRTKRRRRA